MEHNSIATHEDGELKEIEGTKTVIFSRTNPAPLFPFRCPVCGRSTNGSMHNISLLRFGMCTICRMWWHEKEKTIPDATFEEKLPKFFDWVKQEREKMEYRK